MNPDPLRVLPAERTPEQLSSRYTSRQLSRREEVQALMERCWKLEPEKFDPLYDWFGRVRLERTMQLIQAYGSLNQARIADLGCGAGVLSARLAAQGAEVDAVDIASLALERVKAQNNVHLHPLQDYIPHTSLKDESYEFAVACEIIGYLSSNEQRLLFNEVARLVRPEGWIVVSTRLDINSSDALKRFVELAETELIVKESRLSYHHLAIRILDLLECPGRFVRGSRQPDYRSKAIHSRYALSRFWFKLNSHPVVAWLWKPVAWIFTPLAHWLKQRATFLGLCEKASQLLWQEDGATHAILIGQRRPLTDVVTPPKADIPIYRKEKRFVWE